jgi:hypothetical protein
MLAGNRPAPPTVNLNQESTMTTELTASQKLVLSHAAKHTDGKIAWFPDNIKGGARKKVLDSLFNRALITTDGTDWFVATEGYDALGLPHRAPITLAALDAVIDAAEAAQPTEAPKPRTRGNSKQAQVIAMLKRAEGATIAQICEATGWQAHTVRGTFAGAFKKKLGLEITSKKAQGGERVYAIAG